MQTVALISTKGGSFKSGLAMGLSVEAARAGLSVIVVDLDPQATVSNWHDSRGGDSPMVVSAQSSRLRPVLDHAASSGIDLAILDTAGRSDSSALDAARMADLVIIPTRTNIVELETLRAVKDLLALAGSPRAFVVLNAVSPAATRLAVEAREMVTKLFGLECVPAHLSIRTVYARAPETGKAPQEIEPDDKGRARVA